MIGLKRNIVPKAGRFRKFILKKIKDSLWQNKNDKWDTANDLWNDE
jgi:hypothetical protein